MDHKIKERNNAFYKLTAYFLIVCAIKPFCLIPLQRPEKGTCGQSQLINVKASLDIGVSTQCFLLRGLNMFIINIIFMFIIQLHVLYNPPFSNGLPPLSQVLLKVSSCFQPESFYLPLLHSTSSSGPDLCKKLLL